MSRISIFLIFLLFSSFSFSADYAWTFNSNSYSSIDSACQAALAYTKATNNTAGFTWKFTSYTPQNSSQGQCNLVQYQDSSNNPMGYSNPWIYRVGDSCPAGGVYNSTTGVCDMPPSCPAAGTNKLVAFTCDCSGKYCTNPSSFSFEGCGYEKNLVITQFNNSTVRPDPVDPKNSTCTGVATSTGLPLAPSDSSPELCDKCAAPLPEETAEQPSCVTHNAHEFCPDPAQPNCGTRDGQAYCFNETDACGEFNGQMMCIPSSGGRTCSYAAGEYTCVDKTTGKVISSTSSDHPSNGGNADGNDTNDAQAPGAVVTAGGGSAQGSDQGATNKAITDLQGALTDRLDGISDLLGEGEPTAKNINAPTETGSLDLDDWDKKIADAKIELKQSSEGIGDLMNAANNWIITGSGGSLSCFVEDWGRMCLADYQDQLIGIRYVLIFMASILAIYIIFIRD